MATGLFVSDVWCTVDLSEIVRTRPARKRGVTLWRHDGQLAIVLGL
ncbi:MAG TPA: hypothetical protein VF342_16475 [Alphaproteobacteria bacterium]